MRFFRWLSDEPMRVGVGAFLVTFSVTIVLNGWFLYTQPSGQSAVDLVAGIAVEINGALFDAFLFGMVVQWFAVRRERDQREREEKFQRERRIDEWNAQLSDYRGWRSAESSYRTAGILRRLAGENAKIRGTDAYAPRANLARLNLRHAQLENAVLKRAVLVGAELEGAILKLADLEDADLTNANLRGAYLGWANLADATLTGADLTGAKRSGDDDPIDGWVLDEFGCLMREDDGTDENGLLEIDHSQEPTAEKS